MSRIELTGVMYDCNAKNNEEFKKELQKRKKIVIGLFFMGVLMILTMVVLLFVKPDMMEGFHSGFYTGIGSGLMGGAIVGYIHLRKTLRSEESIKAARLAETDEREKEITSKALRASLKAMLAGIYLILLFFAFLSEETIIVLAALLLLFFCSFLIARRIYSKIM